MSQSCYTFYTVSKYVVCDNLLKNIKNKHTRFPIFDIMICTCTERQTCMFLFVLVVTFVPIVITDIASLLANEWEGSRTAAFWQLMYCSVVILLFFGASYWYGFRIMAKRRSVALQKLSSDLPNQDEIHRQVLLDEHKKEQQQQQQINVNK